MARLKKNCCLFSTKSLFLRLVIIMLAVLTLDSVVEY